MKIRTIYKKSKRVDQKSLDVKSRSVMYGVDVMVYDPYYYEHMTHSRACWSHEKGFVKYGKDSSELEIYRMHTILVVSCI